MSLRTLSGSMVVATVTTTVAATTTTINKKLAESLILAGVVVHFYLPAGQELQK
jgi:hypothetical protein